VTFWDEISEISPTRFQCQLAKNRLQNSVKSVISATMDVLEEFISRWLLEEGIFGAILQGGGV
jgi:hypothetical protein